MAHESSSATKRPLAEVLIAYAAFCSLSVLSRFILPPFFLVSVCGIALPLIWGRVTRDWAAMGFTHQRLGQALAWGLDVDLVRGILTGVTRLLRWRKSK